MVSVLLLLHLAAVIVAPWAVPPSSRLSDLARSACQWYLDAMFLGHGYRFFAPNPPERSTLVKYELVMPDGSMPEARVFPSLKEHWPRLLYHRHFMMSETLGREYVPREIPADAPSDAAREEFRARRQFFEQLCRSYARHLLAANGAERVLLYRREHLVPGPLEVARGQRLDDPQSYRDELIGSWTKDEP
jgi:hypothetical protein